MTVVLAAAAQVLLGQAQHVLVDLQGALHVVVLAGGEGLLFAVDAATSHLSLG